MLFTKQLSAIAGIVFATSSVNAATSINTKMPEIYLDGVHSTTNWIPASMNRVQVFHGELASTASWYGVPDGFHGQRTANGEIFDAYGLTAAHRSLPFGTRIRVTNLNNNRSIVVRVTDRGPFVGGRSIDLSQGAAARIGMISTGTAPVKLEVIQ
jgi:rare lipoprotein A